MESMRLIQALLGICVFILVSYLFSEARSKIRWGSVAMALLLQFVFAFATTRIGAIRAAFLLCSQAIGQVKQATEAGTSFVFGYLGGGDAPFTPHPDANTFIFAFQALPTVMVISTLAMLGFHWRILPVLVQTTSRILGRFLNIGGALGVCAAAKIFLGQTEAPLLIRPYIPKLSRSELFTVMTLGMATTSASVMIIYATILKGIIDEPISHILTASIISVPAGVAISRVMIPDEDAHTEGSLISPYKFSGSMEALSVGATDGMKLFLNIIAMLISMLAMVFLANALLSILPWHMLGFEQSVRLQDIFGWIMAPVAWLMGIDWREAAQAGQLLGIKLSLNEVLAFLDLSRLEPGALTDRTRLILLYALCGFANFSSIGIQIGGIGTMVPERRSEIIGLGFRSLLAGTLASCLSGTVIGILQFLPV